MASIGIFLGSATGSNQYALAAEKLGRYIADSRHSIVCGANGSGLMGVLIDAALKNGGEVVGVLPTEEGTDELTHNGLTKICYVKSISERKKTIREKSDVIFVFPGGIGTLDEFFEAFSLKRSGQFHKPIGLLNSCNFYQPLLIQIQNLVDEGFAKEKHRDLITHHVDPVQLLDHLLSELKDFNSNNGNIKL